MVTQDIRYIGVDDKTLDLFEGQYPIPNGIAYNSYLILDDKVAVMDTVDKRKTAEYLDNLERELAGRSPDYLVVTHVEPDHASSIRALVDRYPGIRLVGNAKTFQMLPQYFDLDLSGAVATDLLALGDRVTRVSADGAEIALGRRALTAPDADFFISIHHDSMQQKYIDAGRQREFAGFAIFVSQLNPRYEDSLRCAKAIGEALVAAGEKPSLYHAEPIAGENRPLLDRRLGVHRYDGLAVLKTAAMPAVLVEAGVIVNPDEEARLARPETIQRLARAIADGTHACQRR